MIPVLQALREAGAVGELDLRFADLVGRLAGRAPPDLLAAAALTCALRRSGYVCLDAGGDAAGQLARAFGPDAAATFEVPKNWARTLAGLPGVGKPGARAPLIIEDGRLYLHRFWHVQARVACTLRERAAARPSPLTARMKKALAAHFPGKEHAEQRRAAEGVLTRRLTVIAGGPGTGKTHAVVRALVALAAEPDAPAVALAAPTGKAAARLKEALASATAGADVSTVAHLPQDAATLHRLLRISPADGRPNHDASRPLPYGLVVVDESSMIDLELMGHLLAALSDDARLVLVGDRDQLASVEPGNVLGDLCGGLQDAGGAAAESVVVLKNNFRFGDDSAIRRLADAVNAGDAEGALAVLANPSSEARLLPLPTVRDAGAELRRRGREGWAALRAAESDEAALAVQGHFRILCSHRVGPYGSNRLNGELERLTGGARGRGTPLLVTANDPASGLFNGDGGVWWTGADGGPVACFAGAGGPRRFSAGGLPPHETAFALTVHRSQGSEYDEVVLVLPDRDGPLLTRELVYTAVTRARRHVEICAPADVLAAAIGRRTDRASGLRDAIAKGTP